MSTGGILSNLAFSPYSVLFFSNMARDRTVDIRSSSASYMFDVSTRTTLPSCRQSMMWLVIESLGSRDMRSKRNRDSRRRLTTLIVPSWYLPSPSVRVMSCTLLSLMSVSHVSPNRNWADSMNSLWAPVNS